MDSLEKKRSSYVRVSDVIGKQTERQMRSIPIETMANACLRGTMVHQYCTAYLRNLYIPEYEEDYEIYVNAFIKWAEENIDHLIFSKIRLYDDEREFTGEFDAIVKLKKQQANSTYRYKDLCYAFFIMACSTCCL